MHVKYVLLCICTVVFNNHLQAQQVVTSKPMMPVMAKSNEATKAQLAFAKAEGDSVSRCIQWILHESGAISGQVSAGEYKITYVLSKPEGWYELSNETLTWQQPLSNANAHLWLFVQDGADGRIVPPLTITYTLTNQQQKITDANSIAYAWMPLINGYGDNIKLSGDGVYTLNIHLAAMPYRRHDPYNGDRFTNTVKASVAIAINKNQFNSKPLSDAMEAQLALSKQPGNAFHNTLQEMYKQANDGNDTTADDYKVAYAVEYAEGYWHYQNADFRYMQENDMSGKTNAHVEIAVLDRQTGRFIHNLDVSATLKTKNDKTIGTMKEPFMWHPWLYHYGENWRIPKSGVYSIIANIQPPSYRRYGKISGNRFSKPVSVTFNNVEIKSGQK